ncbi:hypothetical protein GIB67_014974, partial [Kingdonia uniflora]
GILRTREASKIRLIDEVNDFINEASNSGQEEKSSNKVEELHITIDVLLAVMVYACSLVIAGRFGSLKLNWGCRLRKRKNDLEHINEHLIINGLDTTYTTWIHHGEQFSRSYVNSQSSTLPANNVEDPSPSLVSMDNDILEHLPNKVNAEDEVNVEAHAEATTFTCNNGGVNQAQTDHEENIKPQRCMTGAEVLCKMEAIDTKYGKIEENKKMKDLKRKRDAMTNLRYVNLAKLQRNLKNDDEPFILASQATQVFYCKDHSRPDVQWHVVLDSQRVFMSGEDKSSMGASSEPPTTQRKEYRPRGLQVPRGRLIPIQFDDETFDLDPDEHQVMLDYKPDMALKNWKSKLRTNNYDTYEMDEERKSKRPKGIKKEDWIEFVDRLSTPEEHAKHEKGKAPRSKMHSPHTTGRLGVSGNKEILEYMYRAIQNDPMLNDKDLDNDAVSVEYGADENGHVRGYNGHLNKTNIRVSTPLRRVIEWKRVKQAMLNEVQESLEVEANERRQLEKRVAVFESRESPYGGRRCSPPPPESSSDNSCILKDMFGTHVAYRTVKFNITAPEGFYNVIIDEVIRGVFVY